MARARVKGSTPQERARLRMEKRRRRRIEHAREQAQLASHDGHLMVVKVCDTAKSISSLMSETGRRQLAQAIAQAIEAVDRPENRRRV